MKQWIKSNNFNKLLTYTLTKESSPIWFAKVFGGVDDKYTFIYGKRITDISIPQEVFKWDGCGWRSAESAKRKVLNCISQKMNEELCEKDESMKLYDKKISSSI